MQIYPAIDIKDAKAVRLKQGSFSDVTVFNDEPVDAAQNWAKSGASNIHIVDLDGARYGKSFIIKIIKKIKERFPNIFIQTGGGVRNLDDIKARLQAGASRIIIGTAAVKNPDLVEEAVKLYGDSIAVGIDAKNGMAAVKGWEEISSVSALELCLKMKKIGIKTIIYTDISKDGMMCGPNIESTKEIIDKTGLDIIASGGISSVDDLEKIKSIGAKGVIIGKALYNGAVNLSSVINKFERGE